MDALALLESAHRQIEQQLARVAAIATAAQADALASLPLTAIQDVLTYFHADLPRHTADEDLDLFPLVRAVAPDLAAVIVGLEADHRAIEFIHGELDGILAQLLHAQAAGGARSAQGGSGLGQELQRVTDYVVPFYQRHLRTEERQVFVKARSSLTPEQLAALGDALALRH